MKVLRRKMALSLMGPLVDECLVPVLARDFFEWFHARVRMQDSADPCIFGSDLGRSDYSYSAVHCNASLYNEQCVPKASSYLHNVE